MKKVILIDGNNILFRSYYATAYTGTIMRNSKGFPTNGLYGLINMLNKIIAEEKPVYVMVAFDKGKTFRHDKYESYKDGRQETPNDLKLQFPVAKKLVEAMGMTYLEIDNYEADDIIGTFAKCAADDPEYDATIISSDKDLLQLITDDVDVKLLKQVGFVRMNKTEFLNTYGIEPKRMIDLKALMGDASDNIPGVKGIGEKTALTLLKDYQTLDGIYENIDNIKGKLQEKLIEGKESAYMSYDLATIHTEVPIDTDFEKITYKGYDPLKYIEILEELEFNSLIKKLNIEKDLISGKATPLEYEIINDMKDLKVTDNFSIYAEIFGYSYQTDELLSFAIYDGKKAYYIPLEVMLKDPKILTSKYNKYTYDAKRLMYILKRYNLEISNLSDDIYMAAFLLNYNVKDDMTYFMNSEGEQLQSYESVFGTKLKLKMPDGALLAETVSKKAKFIYDYCDKLVAELKEDLQYDLYKDIEMPLAKVLMEMEYEGIKVDEQELDKIGDKICKRIEELSENIYAISGEKFNIASPKQLADVLFKKMEIPYPKKIKDDNYSTSVDILEKIRFVSPIIDDILEFRMLSKIQGTYVNGLKQEITSDGRIHTIFNQMLARTGRLSSSNPNLQNIPIRSEEGRLIRKAFVADKDSVILSSDYSQIELRVFAHMSEASNLTDAFIQNKDIHTKTAMDIFKVKESEVTANMRREAKAVNFGIIYGISAFGLSEDLGIDISSAKKFMDDYLATFPGIKDYMDTLIAVAKRDGYVRTLMGRKRVIPELQDKNFMVRSNGERMALNTPIQGTSADILKKAMIDIYEKFKDKNLKSKMLLQVHDELVFNVLKNELETVKKIVEDSMENAYKLSVPLKASINVGGDWYDA